MAKTKKKLSRKTLSKKVDPAAAKAIKLLQRQAAEARKKAEELLRKAVEFQRKVNAMKPQTSVDIEMQKLQRMITKRAQMFEMVSNLMKKYDEMTRNVIQSIGR